MNHWLFRPLIFYPVAILIAAAIILISLDPLAWRRAPEPQSGVLENGAIVFEGRSFSAPDESPDQAVRVVRSGFNAPEALRIAVLPNQPPPTPAETGARILLSQEAIALLDDRPVHVVVAYRSLPVNPASALAVSLQGIGPADWVTQPLAVGEEEVEFDLPPQFAVNAIGFRAISSDSEHNSGVEIVRFSATPQEREETPVEFIPLEPMPEE